MSYGGCPICGSQVKNWQASSHLNSQKHQEAEYQRPRAPARYGGYYQPQEEQGYGAMPMPVPSYGRMARRPAPRAPLPPVEEDYEFGEGMDDDDMGEEADDAFGNFE